MLAAPYFRRGKQRLPGFTVFAWMFASLQRALCPSSKNHSALNKWPRSHTFRPSSNSGYAMLNLQAAANQGFQ